MYYETIAKTTVHPFYFPTQTVFVDDELDFISSMILIMPVEFSYYWFDNPMQALDYFQDFKHTGTFSKSLTLKFPECYVMPSFDFCLDESLVFKYLSSRSRFDEISSAVIDFVMPEMDGIALSSYIDDRIRKIILTGAADKDKTLTALNQGTINNFFTKEDKLSLQLIAKTIEETQHNYFSSLTSSIIDYLGQDHFIKNKGFKKYFYGMVFNRQIVEYYLIGPNKFLSLNSAGQCFLTLIEDHDSLSQHYEIAKSRNAPQDLLDQLNVGGLIPYFQTDDGFYDSSIQDWRECLYKQFLINASANKFVCTTFPISQYKEYDFDSIYSLEQYKHEFPDGDGGIANRLT